MTRTRKTLLSLFALLLMGGVQLGCNTVDGIGDDAEAVGDEIEETLD